MTIGIAAAGHRAGQAVLDGLKAAEAVGRGALHGFVSFVAIGRDGLLHRAAVQDGGAARLFGGGQMPAVMAGAERAGLMSSGPNRPEPLSQFTPADPAVGLVTGHRFPNTIGPSGRPLNRDVLALMQEGLSAEAAIAAVVASDPAADAGFLALSLGGDLYADNTPYLEGFDDAGCAMDRSADGLSRAGVIHNAIVPPRSLAALVIETTLLSMAGSDRLGQVLTLSAGVALRAGRRNAIVVDEKNRVLVINVRDRRHLLGERSFGLGYQAAVVRRGQEIGHARYEPFLVALNGVVMSINGLTQFDIPLS